MRIRFLGALAILCTLSACQATQEVSPDENVKSYIKHELSETSEVRSGNSEWNIYINHALGLSIQFPKFVLEDSLYHPEGENPTVPVRVVEKGEVVFFSRGYSFDQEHLDVFGNYLRVPEDLSIPKPYYTNAYGNNPSSPYAIYLAKGENINDVRAFVQRTYGKGRIIDKNSIESEDTKSGVMTFAITPNVPDCPGFYPRGIASWYQQQQIIIGVQTRTENFSKPYPVDPMKDLAQYCILATLWVHPR